MRPITPLFLLITLLSIQAASILISCTLPSQKVCLEPSFQEQTLSSQPSNKTTAIDLNKELSSPYLTLHTHTERIYLPDLKPHLLFHGALLRPDTDDQNALLQLSVRGDNEPFFVRANETLYLKYDQGKNQWKKVPSSPLKLTVQNKANVLNVSMELLLPNGTIIKEPCNFTAFSVLETPSTNLKRSLEWKIEGMPVDTHFFEKNNVQWRGKDAFLAALSSDENKKQLQRLIMTSPEGAYTLWLQEHDGCIYEDGLWKPTALGTHSKGKILLYLKSVQDNLITFELWNEDGSEMVPLTLTKHAATPSSTPPTISLIGARSRDTWIASINGERVQLKTDDWILCSEDSIEKIETHEQLEAYMNGEKEGTLLAFSGIERVGSERSLTGIMIDPSRTESTPLAISLFHSWNQKEPSSQGTLQKIDPDKKTSGPHGSHHRHINDDEDDAYDDDDHDSDEEYDDDK